MSYQSLSNSRYDTQFGGGAMMICSASFMEYKIKRYSTRKKRDRFGRVGGELCWNAKDEDEEEIANYSVLLLHRVNFTTNHPGIDTTLSDFDIKFCTGDSRPLISISPQYCGQITGS